MVLFLERKRGTNPAQLEDADRDASNSSHQLYTHMQNTKAENKTND